MGVGRPRGDFRVATELKNRETDVTKSMERSLGEGVLNWLNVAGKTPDYQTNPIEAQALGKGEYAGD